MTFLITFETETISALAIDVYIGTEGASLHQLAAVFVRAPFYTLVLICEISTVPRKILFFKFGFSVFYSF